MENAKLVGEASLCHTSKNEALNFVTYGLKGVASAGITALVLSRFWKPTLAKLSLASLACTSLPVIPYAIAIGGRTALDLEEGQRDWRTDGFTFFGLGSAAIMGGAQIAFLGGTAMRLWNGAFSKLSTAKKIFVPMAMGLSVTELVLLKVAITGIVIDGASDKAKMK